MFFNNLEQYVPLLVAGVVYRAHFFGRIAAINI